MYKIKIFIILYIAFLSSILILEYRYLSIELKKITFKPIENYTTRKIDLDKMDSSFTAERLQEIQKKILGYNHVLQFECNREMYDVEYRQQIANDLNNAQPTQIEESNTDMEGEQNNVNECNDDKCKYIKL